MKRQLKRKSLVSLMGMFALAAAVLVLSPRTHGANSPEGATASEVKIDNFSFSTPSLTVRSGTEVTWVNHDDIPHTVFSEDGLFHSKALDTDDKYSFKFAKPGTYHYFCSIHPKMTGEIVVK
jgi:amicyanin